MDYRDLQKGDTIVYKGAGLEFGGEYKVYCFKDTYGAGRCPKNLENELCIIELQNDDTPMYFDVRELVETEWQKKEA